MSTDAKSSPASVPAAGARHKGMKIFTYPKIIFIWPTMVVALLCSLVMFINRDNTKDPVKEQRVAQAAKDIQAESSDIEQGNTKTVRRFSSIQNVMGILFITVFFLNILIMAIDFPRFTVIAMILAAVAATFFLLWLNLHFKIVPPLVRFLESFYAFANSGFYFLIATAIFINLSIIWVVRYLDYWEILPNEILHNHGPFSDLERFPTTNLKFDKEIPDILEYMLLRSGRLVLHVQNERKAIVLDNVLWIDHKEEQLKKLMSRMEVRVTTDQEAAAEAT
jgi:hypothetical protein